MHDTSTLLLLLLLSPLHGAPEFRTEGVNMTEVEGPEVREEVLVHVLICPTEQFFWSATTAATAVVAVGLFVVWQPRRRRPLRPDTIWQTNEVQAAVMINLYGALDKPTVRMDVVPVWQLRCCRRRHAEGRSTTKVARKSGDVARATATTKTLQGKIDPGYSLGHFCCGHTYMYVTRGNVPASSLPARNCRGRNSSTRSVRVRAIAETLRVVWAY